MALSLYLTQADFAISSVCDARFFDRLRCQMLLASHPFCAGQKQSLSLLRQVLTHNKRFTTIDFVPCAVNTQSVICVRRVCIYAHEAHHSYSTPAPHSPSSPSCTSLTVQFWLPQRICHPCTPYPNKRSLSPLCTNSVRHRVLGLWLECRRCQCHNSNP